ncbi:protein D3 [Drosophila mauritiana]|uniref:Protein D3 n=1 Tax=Drosophila mauritiana TaxID=7226 RepID=A0A6P8K4F3_DROMA|nr:protein D3 [Drosophila mauritiana]
MDDIVPDVLDAVPADTINVIYGDDLEVKQGNELTPTQVKDQPIVSWSGLEGKSNLLTLLMVDPDAPTRQDPKYREILHWSVVNIPGSNVDPSGGHSLADYVGSGPPKDTGLHRYIFLLYQQENKIEETPTISNTTRTGRLNFNTRDFAAKHRLGEPIAANYYQAQYDDYVPIRNKMIVG